MEFNPNQSGRVKQYALLSASLAGALALVGCGRKASVEQALQTKAFDSAPPEIKRAWEAVVSGLHSNGFHVSSQIALWDLRNQSELTDQQKAVVEATLKTLSGRMYDAASRADPAALKAYKDVREGRSDDK